MNYLFAGITDFADRLDFYTLILTLVCAVITGGIVVAMIYFSWRYHHTNTSKRGESIQSYKMEIAFTVFTLAGFMAFFGWATHLYKEEIMPKTPDYEVFVYGKRWMWKFYHPTGFAEVNQLHLPKDKNIRLTMISKDVIHSFFVPGFRNKQDVLPGYYSFLNLRVKKTGDYPLYCAEYCGSYHSRMDGVVSVIEEQEYLRLIKHEKINPVTPGKILFEKHGCTSCHSHQSIFAPPVEKLSKNRDENFIRRSIYYPKEVVEAGYEAVMPSYKDVISEEELRFLIQYIRSMESK